MDRGASSNDASGRAKKSALQAMLDAQEARGFDSADRRGGPSRGAGRSSGNSWRSNRRSVQHSARKPSQQHGAPTYEELRRKIEARAREDSANGTPLDECCTLDAHVSWVGPLVDGKHCTYYQDRDKQYPFHTGRRGYELLSTLMEKNKALLELNQQKIQELSAVTSTASNDTTPDVLIRIGHGLYSDKPTLRTKGVTWSTEEYSHPGLQRMYLTLKSIQRFTETWALLERSAAIGVFDDHLLRCNDDSNIQMGKKNVIRIAAVGGGPGYELLATRLFFRQRAPEVQLELICMDLCEAWRPYAELLGFTFIHYNINNGNLLDAIGLSPGQLHYCIVSCVMIYVTNDRTLDMFHKLIHEDRVHAILMSERGEKTDACSMMEDRGGVVIRLIDPTPGRDERQSVMCASDVRDTYLHETSGDYRKRYNDLTFPNVPYEEFKTGGASWRAQSHRPKKSYTMAWRK